MKNTNHPFIKIASVCAILAPMVMLIADLFLITTGMMFEWTIVLWLSFVLFVPAIVGLTVVLFNNGSRLTLAGGISAFFGAMAGASMQVLFRTHAVLIESGADQTVEMLRGTLKLVLATQSIGLTFPIGLIILAVGIYRSGQFNSLVPVVLVIGALLFPVGRIGGFAAAILGSGIFLTVAFGMIGWRILMQNTAEARLSETELAGAR